MQLAGSAPTAFRHAGALFFTPLTTEETSAFGCGGTRSARNGPLIANGLSTAGGAGAGAGGAVVAAAVGSAGAGDAACGSAHETSDPRTVTRKLARAARAVEIMGTYDILGSMSDAPEKPKGDDAAKSPPRDVVLLGPPTADGEGVHVLRAREDRVEAGEVRPLKEGASIHGEVVKLTPRKDAPQVCDVDVTYAPPARSSASTRGKGPAQVATSSYRNGWDEIFGATKAERPSKALN